MTIEADKLGDMNSLIIHVIHAVRFLAFLYYYNPSWPTYSEQTKLERQNPRPIHLFHTPDEATAERLRLLFQHALDKDEFKLRIAKYLSAVYVKKFDYNNGLFSVAVDLITDRGIPFENEGLEKILELVTVMVEKLLVDPRWLIERTDKIARGAGKKRP